MSVTENLSAGTEIIPAPSPVPLTPPRRSLKRSPEQQDRVRERRIVRVERRWWGRVAISLLILWHAFALFVWLMPGNTPIVQACLGTVRPYLVTTSLVQSWQMFSPNPDNTDVFLSANITYADGSVRPYTFPRMATMDYAKRYREERWRKFTEVSTHSVQPGLWAAAARYAARVNDTNPNNRPVSVELIRHSRQVPPPGVPLPPYLVSAIHTSAGPFILPIRDEDLNAK